MFAWPSTHGEDVLYKYTVCKLHFLGYKLIHPPSPLKIMALKRKVNDEPTDSKKTKLDEQLSGDQLKEWKIAADKGDLATLKLIHQAHPDCIHWEDDYALRRSTYFQHQSVLTWLLENDADIHAKEDEAFRNAVYRRNKEMAQILIDRGCDINVKNGDALSGRLNEDNADLETIEFLLKNNAKITAEMIDTIIYNGMIKALELIVVKYKLYELTNDDGFDAVRHRQVKLVQWMAENTSVDFGANEQKALRFCMHRMNSSRYDPKMILCLRQITQCRWPQAKFMKLPDPEEE